MPLERPGPAPGFFCGRKTARKCEPYGRAVPVLGEPCYKPAMSYKVAAFYQFVALPDFENLREPLRNMCVALDIRGIILLAAEGINGTVAGGDAAIDALMNQLQHGALFDGRLNNLELKFSTAANMPFNRMKVRLKKEIVRLGDPETDPNAKVGTYVDAADWNDLIKQDGVLLLDTRNAFEVEMGTFEGAIDPKITRFGEFPEFAGKTLDPAKHTKIAMFCTGGIRCEKASSYLLSQGFKEVYHLKGGILKYLEDIPEDQSLWRGECFVFDQRIALGHGLSERQIVSDGADHTDATEIEMSEQAND